MWPASLRERSAPFFEHQGLLSELLNHTPGRPPVKSFRLLEEVLIGCDLRLPVLLLLDSDPDVQRALSALPPSLANDADVLRHRAIGKLADRDYRGAADLLRLLSTSRFSGTAAKLLQLADERARAMDVAARDSAPTPAAP
jgi:hypothetical protein